MQAACKKEIFLFDVGVNRPIKKFNAKDASSRIRRRSFQLAFGWKSDRYLIYSWILLIILSIILIFVLQNWAADIRPSGIQMNPGISVTRLDSERIEVIIISVEKDNDINYLTYYTSRGTGIINKSTDPLAPVRDAGESGIIPVSGYSENVEIFVTMHNETMKIYSKTE